MTTIYKETWFDARHDALVRVCLAQIRIKASFEVRVPVRDAGAVRSAIIALAPPRARRQWWWQRWAGAAGVYAGNLRFASLLWVTGRAWRAAFKVFLFEQDDGLRVVFESTR